MGYNPYFLINVDILMQFLIKRSGQYVVSSNKFESKLKGL